MVQSGSIGKYPLWQFLYAARENAEEKAYRDYFLPGDVRQMTLIFSVYLSLLVILSIVDESGFTLSRGVLIRCVLAVSGLGLLFAIRKFRTAFVVDLGISLFLLLFAIATLLFQFYGDTSAARIVAVGIIVIFVGHIALPSYALYNLLPILILLSGNVILLLSSNSSEPILDVSALFVLFFFAELMAVLASAYIHRVRYETFQAMRQNKALTGLLPICANCKKIRNDEGYYEQIEHYITEHSSAEFSHGVCPDCIEVLYPGYGKKREN